MGVEFGILGPLQALVDGTPVSLGGRQQRAVLAILLARANQTVPVDRLIDDVWDDSPPETAGNLLQGYVSQLRKALGKDVIATRGRGYAVVVPSGGTTPVTVAVSITLNPNDLIAVQLVNGNQAGGATWALSP